jgi:hypothetical protein
MGYLPSSDRFVRDGVSGSARLPPRDPSKCVVETNETEVAVGGIVPVPGAAFEDALASVSPDLRREMIKGFAQRMIDAEVEAPAWRRKGRSAPSW